MYVASSLSSIWNYHREGLSREGVMKRYALLYDNIIFNRRGIGIGPGEIASSLGEAVSMLINPAQTLAERRSYGKTRRFVTSLSTVGNLPLTQTSLRRTFLKL